MDKPEKVILYTKDDQRKYKPVTGFEGVFNPEVGRVVSVVTTSYALIPNDMVSNLISPILEDAGLSLKREIDVQGKRHFWEFEFGSPFEPIKDDPYNMWVLVKNSYDRSSALRFTSGFYRAACQNAIVMGHHFEEIPGQDILAGGMTARIIHAGSVKMDTGFKSRFRTFIEAQQTGLDVVQRIASSTGTISLLNGWDILKDNVRKLPKKYYPKAPEGEEPKKVQITPYDFLNEVTAAITHDKRLSRESAIERRNYLLQQLSRALEPLATVA